MATVKYRWSPTSKADVCKKDDFIPKNDVLCYHCGAVIPAGSEAILLQTSRSESFVIHKACEEKSCTPIKEKG